MISRILGFVSRTFRGAQTQRAQQQLAREALSSFAIHDAEITTLRNLGNLVFRVDDSNGQRFALRISDDSPSRIAREIAWMTALGHDTDILLPTVCVSVNGERLVKLPIPSAPDLKEMRWATLFSWIEGEPISKCLSPEIATKLGRQSAQLHSHAQQWAADLDKYALRYDQRWVAGEDSWWMTTALEDLGARDYQACQPAIGAVVECFDELDKATGHFGLIHADRHFGNILVNSAQEPVVLDFDAFGVGYFLFDLAITCLEFDDHKHPELVTHFLDSYRKHAPGLSWEPHHLTACLIAAHLMFVEWVFTSPNPEVSASYKRWVPDAVEGMKGHFKSLMARDDDLAINDWSTSLKS